MSNTDRVRYPTERRSLHSSCAGSVTLTPVGLIEIEDEIQGFAGEWVSF